MENNDLKNSSVNATTDGKFTDKEKPSAVPMQKNSLGEEIIKSNSSNGEVLPFNSKAIEKKPSQAGKLKKKDAESMEVLPNRSWITNFYHNYIKAVESANLNSKSATKHSHNSEPEEGNVMKTKEAFSSSDLPLADGFKLRVASSPFHSLLFFKTNNPASKVLQGLKVDAEVWSAYKNSMVEGKYGVIKNSYPDKNLGLTHPMPLSKGLKPQFKLSDIPTEQFEKLGISQADLLKPGMLENLLKGKNTLPVNNLLIQNSKGDKMPYRASFFLEKKPDGTTALRMNYQFQKPILEVENQIRSYQGGLAMKRQTEEKRAIPSSRETVLKPDKLLNKLLARSNQEKKMPGEIMGVKLNEEQQMLLKQGKEVSLSGFKTKDDKRFHGSIKWDPQKKRIMFISASPESLNKTMRAPKEGNHLAKTEIKAVNLSTEREDAIKEPLRQQPRGIRN